MKTKTNPEQSNALGVRTHVAFDLGSFNRAGGCRGDGDAAPAGPTCKIMRFLVAVWSKMAHFTWRLKLIHNSRTEVRFSECGSPERRGLIGRQVSPAIHLQRRPHAVRHARACDCCAGISVWSSPQMAAGLTRNATATEQSVLWLKARGAGADDVDFSVMNDEPVDQADEEDLLSYEVSDEALEAAAGNEALPTATFICSGFCCQS
jgi:hypothetical protein